MYSRRRVTRRPRMVSRRPRTARRQAFGNFAAALQQRDSTNIVASVQENVTLQIPVKCSEATIVRNVNAILTSSTYFRNYMGMYDQYKINSVRAAVEVLALNQQVSNSNSYPNVCTAWDRNGAQIQSVNLNDATTGAATDNWTYKMPSYSDVCSYSSANEKTIYYGARWGVVRQLDAASMQEKSTYIPTTQTKDVLSYGNIYSAWNPCLLLSLKTTSAPTDNAWANNIFSIHWQFDVTLRGLRKVDASDTVINLFKPYPGFVGYDTSTISYGVAWDSDKTKFSNVTLTGVSLPSINPAVTVGSDGTLINNSLTMHNTGLAADNKNLAV